MIEKIQNSQFPVPGFDPYEVSGCGLLVCGLVQENVFCLHIYYLILIITTPGCVCVNVVWSCVCVCVCVCVCFCLSVCLSVCDV